MKTLIIAALLCVPGLLAVASFPVVDSSASECWAMATFQPDGSAFVKQNFTSSQGGRTCVAEPALSLSKGPYNGRAGVRKTKFHVESSGTGDITNKGKAPKPQSSQSPDSCLTLWTEGHDLYENQQWLQSYDTLKKFVELCPNDPNAANFAFEMMGGDQQELTSTDTALWTDFQLWLRSVLYLNTTNPEYFCQCARQISPWIYYPVLDSSAFAQFKQTDTSLAVDNWLIQNTTCDTPALMRIFGASRASQYTTWLEDSESGINYPYDTTLPPLSAFGLDTLFDRHFLYLDVPQSQEIISNATANPNPVTSGTVISFGISQEAYVKIEVFDILGHEVASAGFESLFEPGNKSVPISLAGLPSGTYFARILTAYGEVQSVKLVKE